MKTRESNPRENNRGMEQNRNQENLQTQQTSTRRNTKDLDQLEREAEQQRNVRKPGSQSNHSKQHNNGRGGGK